MRNARGRALAAGSVRWTIIAGLMVAFGGSLAHGQDVTKWDVFGGYSYMRFDSRPIGFQNASNLNGWNAAVAYNFTDALSLAGDASGHYGNQISAYTYSLAPQYSYRWEHSRVFAQFLIGKAQDNVNIMQPTRGGFESVSAAIGGGGGYDWDYNSRYSLRVQADYLHTKVFHNSENNVRVSAGVVVHFGTLHKKRRL